MLLVVRPGAPIRLADPGQSASHFLAALTTILDCSYPALPGRVPQLCPKNKEKRTKENTDNKEGNKDTYCNSDGLQPNSDGICHEDRNRCHFWGFAPVCAPAHPKTGDGLRIWITNMFARVWSERKRITCFRHRYERNKEASSRAPGRTTKARKLLGTSASLLGARALLVVTRSY